MKPSGMRIVATTWTPVVIVRVRVPVSDGGGDGIIGVFAEQPPIAIAKEASTILRKDLLIKRR